MPIYPKSIERCKSHVVRGMHRTAVYACIRVAVRQPAAALSGGALRPQAAAVDGAALVPMCQRMGNPLRGGFTGVEAAPATSQVSPVAACRSHPGGFGAGACGEHGRPHNVPRTAWLVRCSWHANSAVQQPLAEEAEAAGRQGDTTC